MGKKQRSRIICPGGSSARMQARSRPEMLAPPALALPEGEWQDISEIRCGTWMLPNAATQSALGFSNAKPLGHIPKLISYLQILIDRFIHINIHVIQINCLVSGLLYGFEFSTLMAQNIPTST